MGKRVAFLGVDTDDTDAAAKTFLDELPLPYPSVSDPDRDIFDEYRGPLRPAGDRRSTTPTASCVFVKQGPYRPSDDLVADIERYAS